MFQGNVCSGRKHTRTHELVGCVCLFPPKDKREYVESYLVALIQYMGMIRIEPEDLANLPCRIADIDACQTAVYKEAIDCRPGFIELIVHK